MVACRSARRLRRARPYIVLVATKWHPDRTDLCNEGVDQNLVRPWNALGCGHMDVWHPDAWCLATGQSLEANAHATCWHVHDRHPDLVLLPRSPWETPEWWTWLQIVSMQCRQDGVPILTVWYDSVADGDVALMERMLSLVDGHIQLDRHVPPRQTSSPDRYLPMWTVHDPGLFYTGMWDRSQALTCVGDWEQPVRRRIRQRLDQAGIAYTLTGGQRHTVEYETYARSCRRSQMLINTNNHPTCAVVKGHVFEAISCGALLLEQHYESGGTHHRLTSHLEYVPYESDDELVERIQYYQHHAGQRDAIAQNGARAYWTRYSPFHFWSRVWQFVGRAI